jgi:hypothetical protein
MKTILAFLPMVALAGCGDNLSHPPVDAATDAGVFQCVPNLDGKIEASELKAALNLPVTYVVSPPGEHRTVDLAGVTDGAGHPTWDFSQSLATDRKVVIAASALNDKWYQASFPGGQWVAPVDAAGADEAVYAADDQAIYLLGLASKDEDPQEGKTLIVYGEKVAVYRFPLSPGASWVSVGTVQNGMLRGLPYAGTDTYEVGDVATGEMQLHDFVFTEAHRVRTKVTLAPSAGASVVTRQDSFMFECFGEIVRAVSDPDEQADDFTMAAEVRRLGD